MGQEVEVRPGIVTKDAEGRAACLPIYSRIVSLKAEDNALQYAVPGGLIGVGMTVGAPFQLPQASCLLSRCDQRQARKRCRSARGAGRPHRRGMTVGFRTKERPHPGPLSCHCGSFVVDHCACGYRTRSSTLHWAGPLVTFSRRAHVSLQSCIAGLLVLPSTTLVSQGSAGSAAQSTHRFPEHQAHQVLTGPCRWTPR
jgi:hypothetical protein